MLNRRDFLKLAAISTSALAFRPFQSLALPDFPQADRLGRIAVGNIQQIEIVKGPATSLYGSDALAGVINIISEKIKDTNTELQIHHGRSLQNLKEKILKVYNTNNYFLPKQIL